MTKVPTQRKSDCGCPAHPPYGSRAGPIGLVPFRPITYLTASREAKARPKTFLSCFAPLIPPTRRAPLSLSLVSHTSGPPSPVETCSADRRRPILEADAADLEPAKGFLSPGGTPPHAAPPSSHRLRTMEGPAAVSEDHLDPPMRIVERLRQIAGYTWDDVRAPYHTSYDNW